MVILLGLKNDICAIKIWFWRKRNNHVTVGPMEVNSTDSTKEPMANERRGKTEIVRPFFIQIKSPPTKALQYCEGFDRAVELSPGRKTLCDNIARVHSCRHRHLRVPTVRMASPSNTNAPRAFHTHESPLLVVSNYAYECWSSQCCVREYEWLTRSTVRVL